MDYEKKYKEALERAREALNDGTISSNTIAYLQDIFPEFKESEDEKIRKELIKFVKVNIPNEERYIAWLEKQGEKKQDVRYENLEELLVADDIYQMAMNDEMVQEAKEKAINALSEMCIGRLLGVEKQGEQKVSYTTLVETGDGGINAIVTKELSTDKVEPKFKVGDKIRRKTPSSFDKDMQVARIEKDYYICNHIGKFTSEVVLFSEQSGYELIEQNLANNIEPMFKVGDWIISTLPGIKYPHLITDIRDGYYIFGEDDDHAHIASNDNILKLWTIQDAKEGDVLSGNYGTFIFLWVKMMVIAVY